MSIRAFTVDICIDSPHWDGNNVSYWEDVIGEAINATLFVVNPVLCQYSLVFSVLFTDDDRICKLNREFRGKNIATNILSWPALLFESFEEKRNFGTVWQRKMLDRIQNEIGQSGSSEGVFIGDIALSYSTIEREATHIGAEFSDYVAFLVMHGVLHLLGYTHDSDSDEQYMKSFEKRACKKMGLVVETLE